ncbi:MAG: SPFH domain-containing protein [Solirubrobacterales bacterium]|nr:SPFH domain-containing protein [Solirubrobacterales bacterium]
MPLFEGHRDKGIERLFIEMPDQAKGEVAWKWPDQQIVKYSQLNVDLDYQAVFTNLGKVIGVMGPGRYRLDEGASLALGWLVDRLTGDAYYDAEVYFVATRDVPNVEFGGPVDNLTDGPTGLVVTLRVFGELAFKVTDPATLLAKLSGTGPGGDFNSQVSTWATDQTLAAIRAVLPDIVAAHGVLAMGQLQDATSKAALVKVNEALAPYGLAVTTFGELNVNLPDADAQQLKQFAATKAYSNLSGSFDGAVRAQAALEIAGGIANGNVGAQPGIVAGMMMGVPVAPAPAMTPAAPAAASPSPIANAPTAAPAANFCGQCGAKVAPGMRFCPNCGTAIES